MLPLQKAEYRMVMGDRRQLVANKRISDVQVALSTGHRQFEALVVFAVLPGSDDVVIIGSKTLREKLYIVFFAAI